MYSHIVVGANDIAAAKKFYDSVMGALGYPEGNLIGDRVIYSGEAGMLMVTKSYDGNEATFGNGVTIGFNAATPNVVDSFHASGLAAGGSDDAAHHGAPGLGQSCHEAPEDSCDAYLPDQELARDIR